ncbi:MAG: rhodanese-like domain-containing protein [Chitinophagales bacterium]|nr:rhodanese-like domain-containing protein [Chitinophagales bacterium]
MKLLTEEEFAELISHKQCLAIDSRSILSSADKFIEGALCIPWGENFIPLFQKLVDDKQNILLLCDAQNAEEIIRNILATGFSNISGWIDPSAIKNLSTSVIIVIDADEFKLDYDYDEFYLIDVRDADLYEKYHIEFSQNIPLDDIDTVFQDLDPKMRIYIVGDDAMHAFTAASLLKMLGFELIRVVGCNFDELVEKGLPIIRSSKNSSPSQ